MVSLVGLTLLLTLAQLADDAPRLAVIKPAPPFQLIDHNGKQVRLSDLKEDVLVVGFIFTTCNGTCPATTHRMAKVYDELRERGLVQKGKVRFLSLTLDPERDQPEALRNYMHLYEIDPKGWTFLTGPNEAVNQTVAAWGMWAKPAANGQLDHPSRIYLVDRERNIREIYNLGFMNTRWVAEDVEALAKEPTARPR